MDPLTIAKKMKPEEVVALLGKVAHLESKLESSQAQVRSKDAIIGSKNSLIESKDALIRWFQQQLFGPSSEKRALRELPPSDQLWLGEQMLEHTENPPPEDETVRSYERKQRAIKKSDLSEDCSSSRLKFDDSVPVKEVQVDDPELAALDIEKVEIIGEDVTYRLAQQSPYIVLKYVRKVWKEKSEDSPRKAPMPAAIFERSYADVSFLAGLAVEKCCFHLPLHRQHARLKQNGIKMERSTLTRLLQRVAEVLEPIYDSQMSSILQSSVLAVDESPTPAGRGVGKIKNGYYWALHGDQAEVCFFFSPSRSQKVLDSLLGGFQGTLLSDGYRAYEAFCEKNPDAVLANCWAHTRRYFIKAEKAEPEKTKWVLRQLQKLYQIEARARGKPKKLKKLRDLESRPIVDELFSYLQNELERTSLLPSNPFVVAVEYAIGREDALRVFLENPEIAMDTNHLEREIRNPVIGRKNWMFHTTENGARQAGILYSLLQTCRLNDINPRTYLIDVLQRIDFHPAIDASSLRPVEWKKQFSVEPLRSAVD